MKKCFIMFIALVCTLLVATLIEKYEKSQDFDDFASTENNGILTDSIALE